MARPKRNGKNQTIAQIYEEYRDEMRRVLSLEETAPHMFVSAEFVECFERKVEWLDTLIAAYGELLSNQYSD